jgi:pimeloyl-ACP methyl ester carboxylesterase
MPDLPGFGGMQSFYTIGDNPTIDAYADYLAAFAQLRYKRRRLVIVAMSFSVPLVVRMLQRYPDLAKKVDFIVSTVGFVHRDDFVFSKPSYYGLRILATVGQTRIASAFLRSVVLRGPIIQLAYSLAGDRHSKMKDAEKNERKKRIDYEKKLWKMNDVRTRMSTLNMMLTMDVCDRAVDLPMYHVSPNIDRYFNNDIVCQHMQVIFEKFESVSTTMPAHAPTVIASAKQAAPYVPRRIQRLLSE